LLVVLAGVSVHFTFQLVFEAASTDSAINSDVGITPTLSTRGMAMRDSSYTKHIQPKAMQLPYEDVSAAAFWVKLLSIVVREKSRCWATIMDTHRHKPSLILLSS
jgi:hypothetical protein